VTTIQTLSASSSGEAVSYGYNYVDHTAVNYHSFLLSLDIKSRQEYDLSLNGSGYGSGCLNGYVDS